MAGTRLDVTGGGCGFRQHHRPCTKRGGGYSLASGRGISFDRNAARVCSRFRHVVGELHSEEVIHVRAEGLFDTQGHFRRQRSLTVQKVGERGATHLQNLRRLRHAETEGFNDLRSNQVARMGRFLHGHCGLLVVIDQINVAGRVHLFVEAENKPPVSRDCQAP